MDIIEQEANYFAMCLLMPEQFVRVDITAMGGIDLTEDRQIRDLANICKQVEDALIGVVFRDDALIVRYDTMQKRYSAQPKIVATYQPVRS